MDETEDGSGPVKTKEIGIQEPGDLHEADAIETMASTSHSGAPNGPTSFWLFSADFLIHDVYNLRSSKFSTVQTFVSRICNS